MKSKMYFLFVSLMFLRSTHGYLHLIRHNSYKNPFSFRDLTSSGHGLGDNKITNRNKMNAKLNQGESIPETHLANSSTTITKLSRQEELFEICDAWEVATQIFDDEFGNWTVHESHINPSWHLKNTDEDASCIMENASLHLAHPMIDYNTAVACDIIYKAAHEKRNYRDKPVCAMVRGRGGGKTRQIIEIKDHFLQHSPTVFPLAITFSGKWNINNETHRVKSFDTSHPHYDRTIIEAIVRMISVFYGVKLSKVCRIFNSSPTFQTKFHRIYRETILRGCIEHLSKAIKKHRPEVDTFILMIDDSTLLCDFMKRLLPRGGRDFISVLRDRILEEDYHNVKNIGVLLAAENSRPFGYSCEATRALSLYSPTYSDFGRAQVTFEYLTPSTVAKNWFNIPINAFSMSLISCFSGSPIGLLLLNQILKTGNITEITNANFISIFQEAVAKYSASFPSSKLPAKKYVHSLIFCKQIKIDDGFVKCLESSLFINYMHPCHIIGERELCSRSALSVLYATLLQSSNTDYGAYMLRRLDNILACISESNQINRAKLLKLCVKETLLMRLRTAVAANVKFTLADLTSIQFYDFPSELNKLNVMPFGFSNEQLGENQGLPSLLHDSKAFFAYLNKHQSRNLYEATSGDCFDLLLLLKLKGLKLPYLIFFKIDPSVVSPNDNSSLKDMKFNCSQAEAFLNSFNESGASSPLFRPENVLYVYVVEDKRFGGKESRFIDTITSQEMEGGYFARQHRKHTIPVLAMIGGETRRLLHIVRYLYVDSRSSVETK